MKVRNKNLAGSELILGDVSYCGDAEGVFDVPPAQGNWLCGTPGWSPYDGKSVGSVVSRPPEMTEEDHAQQLVREAARAQVVPPPPLPPPALGAPPPPPSPPPPPPPPPAEGPDLDRMTAKELIATAEDYRLQGYEIDLSKARTKNEIKATIAAVIFENDATGVEGV